MRDTIPTSRETIKDGLDQDQITDQGLEQIIRHIEEGKPLLLNGNVYENGMI